MTSSNFKKSWKVKINKINTRCNNRTIIPHFEHIFTKTINSSSLEPLTTDWPRWRAVRTVWITNTSFAVADLNLAFLRVRFFFTKTINSCSLEPLTTDWPRWRAVRTVWITNTSFAVADLNFWHFYEFVFFLTNNFNCFFKPQNNRFRE